MEAAFEGFVERHEEALPELKRLWLESESEDTSAVTFGEKMGHETGLDVEVSRYAGARNTEEMEAGIAAFLQRRTEGEALRQDDPYHWVIAASR